MLLFDQTSDSDNGSVQRHIILVASPSLSDFRALQPQLLVVFVAVVVLLVSGQCRTFPTNLYAHTTYILYSMPRLNDLEKYSDDDYRIREKGQTKEKKTTTTENEIQVNFCLLFDVHCAPGDTDRPRITMSDR